MTIIYSLLSIFDKNINPADTNLDIEEQKSQTKFALSDIGKTIHLASKNAIIAKTIVIYNKYILFLYL